MTPMLVALILVAQDPQESGVARIRRDAEALSAQVSAGLARDFLKAAGTLPSPPARTLYYDQAGKAYLTERDAEKLADADRAKLRKLPTDETFYYNTRYGSPLAYCRPMEVLG